MKIRNGFVSNSSSSSFIVIFKKDPQSKEELQKILFGNKRVFHSTYGDSSYTTLQIAETVWNDMKNQEKNDVESAKDQITNGYLEDEPDYDDYRFPNGDIDWENLRIAQKRFADKKFKEFFNTRKNKLNKINGQDVEEVFYIFHYADDEGEYGSTLEHGDIFRNLKHIRISHH